MHPPLIVPAQRAVADVSPRPHSVVALRGKETRAEKPLFRARCHLEGKREIPAPPCCDKGSHGFHAVRVILRLRACISACPHRVPVFELPAPDPKPLLQHRPPGPRARARGGFGACGAAPRPLGHLARPCVRKERSASDTSADTPTHLPLAAETWRSAALSPFTGAVAGAAADAVAEGCGTRARRLSLELLHESGLGTLGHCTQRNSRERERERVMRA